MERNLRKTRTGVVVSDKMDKTIVVAIRDWLKPCVVGLIGAAAVILVVRAGWAGGTPTLQVVTDNFPDWKSWLLLSGAFAASYWGKVNPIYLILAGAVLGLLLY